MLNKNNILWLSERLLLISGGGMVFLGSFDKDAYMMAFGVYCTVIGLYYDWANGTKL